MKELFKSLMVLAFVWAVLSCSQQEETAKPTIYTIGDSTVKCGQGKGGGGLWGWGEPFQFFFDTTQVNLVNVARGGTSSRTYRTLGLWQPTLDSLKAGDFVFIQFGHNDAGALNDSTCAGHRSGESAMSLRSSTIFSQGRWKRSILTEPIYPCMSMKSRKKEPFPS
ncbi:SGNH/GDSL hydrolase family protein [Geofilum rubicundum]|uniref:Rhamnogalacturonan acetylesterase n=1 Tax=Geofilum rubicundum JCM 15548 TaxID=1236989 RepID=A0A0E9LV60_9BACT|nr:SGNH/GDSL hydrolase family protein [Geofilum rubicundum]GAO29457.1 rhamnogalacturonan acetylesterase [Geofilum rubicundum JCM 15548]